jgi:hypothetical protein
VSGVCFAVLAQFDDVARLETFDRAHRLARITLDQRQARSPKRRPPRPSRRGCRSVGNSGRFKTCRHRVVVRSDRQKTDPGSFASYFVGELSTLARTHPEQCRIQRYDTHRGPPNCPCSQGHQCFGGMSSRGQSGFGNVSFGSQHETLAGGGPAP